MKRLLIASFFLLLPLLLLAAGAVFLVSDRGLNEVVRPRLELSLGERLDAEVRLGRLTLDRRRLAIDALFLDSEGKYRIEVAGLEIRYTLSGLLERRVESLRLENPVVEIRPAGGEPGEGGAFRLPLSIERLQIVNGRLLGHAAGREWPLEDLSLMASLKEESPFYLSAHLGEGEGVFLEAHGTFFWRPLPALTLDGVRWEGRELLSSPLTMDFPEDGARIGGGIRFERLDHELVARLGEVLGLDPPVPPEWGFTLLGVRARFGLEGEALGFEAQVDEGTAGKGGREIFFKTLDVKGEGRGGDWAAEGTLFLDGSAPARFKGRLAGGEMEGSASLKSSDPIGLLRGVAGGEWPDVDGGIALEAKIRAAEGRFQIDAELQGRPGEGRRQDLPDLSPLSADLVLAGEGENVSGSLRLRREGGEFLTVQGDGERFSLSLRPSAGRNLALLLPRESRPALLETARGIAGTAEAVRSAKGWSGRVDLRAEGLVLEQGALEEIRFGGSFRQEDGVTSLSRTSFAARFSEEGVSSAVLSAAGRGDLRQDVFHLVLDRFAATELEYMTADGMSGFAGGRLEGKGTISGRSGGAVHLDLSADFGLGEVLSGAFYADLSGLPGRVALRGEYHPDRNALDARRIEVLLPGIAAAALRGGASSEGVDLAGSLTFPDLEEASRRLDAILAESLPAVAGLKPSGVLAVEGALLRTQDEWRLQGTAFPEGFDLHWADKGVEVAGLSGEIPFDIGSAPRAGDARHGTLALSRLAFGPLELVNERIGLVGTPGRFAPQDPLVFRLAGGELEIAEPAIDLNAGSTEFTATLAVRGADLGRLTREAGLIEMTGDLSADLGRIRYAGGSLSTEGEMRIDAFGGHIRVRNLRMDSLFSAYPSYSADADFTGIDLQQLTHTLEFGEINGIADGYIRELRLLGKVPSRFEALLETRGSGRRNISVKALRNLTTISQGGLSAALSRGIYRFIDFYRYRKIGLYCTLRADVFTLRGTARDDTDRYLVDGGLFPPKINIIAPEHTISFKEMIKRLQRVERERGEN